MALSLTLVLPPLCILYGREKVLTPLWCSCTLGPVELCMYWFCVVCQCVGLYYCIQQLLYCVTVRYTVGHNHHFALMVDIGSCLQQSLDCLGVSMIGS